jgi:hypothetical protein
VVETFVVDLAVYRRLLHHTEMVPVMKMVRI